MPKPVGRNRRVVLYGNPVLRTRSRRVDELTDEIRQILADLKVTMMEQDGLGLAANQIGEPLTAFAVNPRGADVEMDPCCIVNPKITATEGNIEAEEGCLSLPGLFDFLPRPEQVTVTGTDEEGKPVTLEATGLLARAILHEVDHLSGVLFIDHLSESRRKMLASRLKELEDRERTACA
jgi:peptide deformylase